MGADHKLTARQTTILKDLFLHAVEADRQCAGGRTAIYELLEREGAHDHPEAPYVLLSRRGRGSLRDRITEYVLEVSDLCAVLAPAAFAHARGLAAALPAGDEERIVELPRRERHRLLRPLFRAAGIPERLRPVEELA